MNGLFFKKLRSLQSSTSGFMGLGELTSAFLLFQNAHNVDLATPSFFYLTDRFVLFFLLNDGLLHSSANTLRARRTSNQKQIKHLETTPGLLSVQCVTGHTWP